MSKLFINAFLQFLKSFNYIIVVEILLKVPMLILFHIRIHHVFR